MRDIGSVIDQILNITTNESLIRELNAIKNASTYKAPELQRMLWDDVGNLLGVCYPNPLTSEESLEIASIFTAKSKEELQTMYSEVL